MLGRIELPSCIGAVDQIVVGIDQTDAATTARSGTVALLAHHVVEITLERIVACGRIVAIWCQMQHRPQLRHRREMAGGALRQEMRQRERIRRNFVGVTVPGGIEVPDRPATFVIAVAHIMQQRVHAGRTHVRIMLKIPFRVEIPVRPAMLAPTEAVEVHERLQFRVPHVRVLHEIPGGVEQAGCVELFEFGVIVGAVAHGTLSW